MFSSSCICYPLGLEVPRHPRVDRLPLQARDDWTRELRQSNLVPLSWEDFLAMAMNMPQLNGSPIYVTVFNYLSQAECIRGEDFKDFFGQSV